MININNLICPSLKKSVNYTVYENRLCGDTLQELLNNFCAYINECIDYVNKYSNYVEQLLEWAKKKGIEEYVRKILNEWVDSGKFEEIINQEIFGDLSNDVEELKKKVDGFDKKLEDLKNEVETSINEALEKVDEKINELETSVNKSLEDVKNKINEIEENLNNVSFMANNDWEYKLKNVYGLTDDMDLYGPLTRFAEDVKNKKTHGLIYIPSGDYIISQTIQGLDNLTIVFDPQCTITMLDSCRMGVFSNGVEGASYDGRSAGSNVTIIGGIFKGGSYYLSFALGKNITLKDMTIYGEVGNHVGEFSGCYNSIVENCTFYGLANRENYRDEAEALQVSTQTEAGYPFFGHNPKAINTTNEKFRLRNCYFKNFSTGFGSHGAVHGYWDTDYIIEGNTFENMDVCGVRLFAMDSAIIRNNNFINCKKDILCDGIIQNSELGRPTSQSCQHIVISDNGFIGTTKDFETSVYIKGARRTENEGGYSLSADIVIKNNKFNKYKGYGVRVNFGKHVVISGNTGFIGNCIRVSYSERVNIVNNIMEAKEGNFLSVSRDPGYFEADLSCKYVHVSGNNIIVADNTGVNISYCWYIDFMDNIVSVNGDGDDRMVININSGTKKGFISNNTDYFNNNVNGPVYTSSSATSDIKFSNNVSKGYSASNNTQCSSSGASGVFTPTYS